VRALHSSSARSARVDLLRGTSIFAVLLLHFSLSYDLIDSPLSRILPKSVVARLVLNGNYGVTVFFAISGFLITANNLARYTRLGEVRLRDFYAYRFSRIIPPLILALSIISALALFGVPSFVNDDGGQKLSASFFAIGVLSVLTFWHNVLMQWAGYFNYCLNIYWSLSVEEVFYLGFPIACIVLKREKLIGALCAIFIVAGPAYRAVHRSDELYFEYGYLACFDAIAFGCMTALLYQTIRAHRLVGRATRCAAAIGLIAVYLLGIDHYEVFGFSMVALGASLLLTNAFDDSIKQPKHLLTMAVCWLGRHSYELYLFHIIVLAGARNLVRPGTLPYAYKVPGFVVFVMLSALLAGVVARFYAEPLNGALRAGLSSVQRPRAAGP